jgi:hypothetical protein
LGLRALPLNNLPKILTYEINIHKGKEIMKYETLIRLGLKGVPQDVQASLLKL